MTATNKQSIATSTSQGSRQMRRAARFAPGKSIKIRIGGRIMLLVWRTRARVAKLLFGMLSRSLRQLSLGTAATVATIGGSMAGAGTLPNNALPTGGVVVNGLANINQASNSLNIVQRSNNAILNWTTFNIGSAASVNFQQPNSSSATLNRVMSNDPSALMGRLTANGKVWLINPAGIMVGKGAKIDVGGFVASTLNVRDEDFLANRLNFTGGSGAGTVSNFGSITTPAGGNVYLVGANVDNQGVITTPGGEVLLGAGHTVQLADTGTPGVKIEITGTDGSATNLGQIVSEAGRIGLAGALVKNTGVLNASSVSKDGGRIFLTATQAVTTGAASTIAADGITGGKVTVYGDDSASIDGAISALGSAGKGGFVETSGKRQLSIMRAPSVGRGGDWLIDPNNVTIQASGTATNVSGGPAYTTTNDSAIITTGMIESALNAGTNVSITTGALGTNSQVGDITVASSITKSAGTDAMLTLTANHSVFINQPISSTVGKLNFSTTANSAGGTGGSVNVASSLALNGGTMTVAGPLGFNGATLSGLVLTAPGAVTFSGINNLNADVSLANATLSSGTLQGTGKLTATNLNWSGGTIAGVAGDPAYDVTNLTLTGSATLDGRTLSLLSGGTSKATNAYLTFKNSAVLNNAGTLTVANGSELGYYSPTAGTSVINNTGTINSTNTTTYPSTNSLGTSYDAVNGVAFNNAGTVNVTDGTLQLGGGGTQTGAFNVSASTLGSTSTLRFGDPSFNYYYYYYNPAKTQNINAGATVTETMSNGGIATVDLSGSYYGTTNLTPNLSLTNAAISNGTLQGSGQLTATNLNWSGGSIAGVTGNPSYDVTNLTLTGSATLDGRTLNLLSGGTSKATSAYLMFKNSAVLNNAGTLTLTNGSALGYYSPTAGTSVINNTGTINSTNTTTYPSTNSLGTSYDAVNGVAFNNAGTVNVTDGTLQLGGGGTQTGAFNVSANTLGGTSTLRFGDSSYNYYNYYNYYYNNYYYNYYYNYLNYYNNSARTQNINAGATFSETMSRGGIATVDLSGGYFNTTNLTPNLTLANAAISSGVLQGSGKLTATNLNWSGGTISGVTGNPAYDVTNLTLTGYGALDGRTLNLLPSGVSKASNAYLTFKNSAVLNNAGTLTVADGSQLGSNYSSSAGTSAINNSGTINSSNTPNYSATNTLGGGYDAYNGTTFNNSGIVNVTDGTLQLGGGGTQTGAFNVTANTLGSTSTLRFGDSYNYYNYYYYYYYGNGARTQNINAGATFTEKTTNGGIATVDLSGNYYSTTNLVPNLSLTNAAISGGTLQGPGKLTATNLNWSGGRIAGVAGDPGYDVTNLTLNNYQVLDGRTLNLLAGGNSKATYSYLEFRNSAALNNAGTLTLAGYNRLGTYGYNAGSSVINNSGTINSSDYSTYWYGGYNFIGSNYDSLNGVAFNNGGTVNVINSYLNLGGSGVHTGAFNVIANAAGRTSKLSFGSDDYYYYYYNSAAGNVQSINAGASITETESNGGTASVVLSDAGFFGFSNNTTNLNTDLTLKNVTINGGTLQGTGKLTATNLTWRGGKIAGNTGAPAYDVTNLKIADDYYNYYYYYYYFNGSNPAGAPTLDGRTLNLLAGGTSSISHRDLVFKNSAVLNNAGTLNISNGASLGSYTLDQNAGASAINNTGTINSANPTPTNPYPFATSYNWYTGTYTFVFPTQNNLGGSYDALNGVAFNNAGTVNVTDGTLGLAGGGTHTGAFNVSASTAGLSTALTFGSDHRTFTSSTYARSQNINAGATITETSSNGGIASVSLSTSNADNVGTTNLNTNLALTNTAINGGTLQGSGQLSATYLAWSGGTIAGSAGTPAYDVTNLTMNGAEKLDGRTLNLLAGGVSTATSAALSLNNSAVLNNAGALTITAGTQLGASANATTGSSFINNTGTIVSTNSLLGVQPNVIGNRFDALNGTIFNNAGSLTVASANTLSIGGSASIVNNGSIRVDTAATLVTNSADLLNSASGTVSGSGMIDLGGSATLVNNGTVSPGSSGATGTLTLNGNYVQGSSGTFMTRIGGVGAGQFDALQVSGNVDLNGAFSATSLNGYSALIGDAITVIGSTTQTSTVRGTFATVSAPANMFAGYGLYSNAPFRLNFASLGSVFFNNAGGDFSWSNPLNWSSKSVPVLLNDVLIDAGSTVQHASGNDIVSSLVIRQNNGLNVSGGSLSVINQTNVAGTLGVNGLATVNLNGGLNGTGTLSVNGGTVNLKGVSSIGNLAMSSGSISGNSDFSVTNSFVQNGGTMLFNTSSVAFRQLAGNMTIGNLTASRASLLADNGAIVQGAGTINVGSLVTQSSAGTKIDNATNTIGSFTATNSGSGDVSLATLTSLSLGPINDINGAVSLKSGGAITQSAGITSAALNTTSATGTILNSANFVGQFAAMNSTSGDISLVNTTRPQTLMVGVVTNNGGDIAVDNTGGIMTVGGMNAAKGSLSLTAHSPITVNSSLTALNGITLTALGSTSAVDTITLNGSLSSISGSVALSAGTSTTVASTATVSVQAGNAINLKALAGKVSVVPGATFIGATPTIFETVPDSSVLPASIPTTIDSLQKASLPLQSSTLDSSLFNTLLANSTNVSHPYFIESATIGGKADSFGGGSSSGSEKTSDSNDPNNGTEKSSKNSSTPAKSLPVCN